VGGRLMALTAQSRGQWHGKENRRPRGRRLRDQSNKLWLLRAADAEGGLEVNEVIGVEEAVAVEIALGVLKPEEGLHRDEVVDVERTVAVEVGLAAQRLGHLHGGVGVDAAGAVGVLFAGGPQVLGGLLKDVEDLEVGELGVG